MKKIKYKILTKMGYLSLCIETEEIIPCIIVVTNEKDKDVIDRMVLKSDDIENESFDKLLYDLNLMNLENSIFLITLENYKKKLQTAEAFKSYEKNNPRNKISRTEKDRIKRIGSIELQHDINEMKEGKNVSFLTTEIEEEDKSQPIKDEKEERNDDKEKESSSENQPLPSITEEKKTTDFINDFLNINANDNGIDNNLNDEDKKKETEEVPAALPKKRKERGNYKVPLTVENVKKYYLDDNLSLTQCSETMGIPKPTLNKFISVHPELKKKQKNRETSDDSKEDQLSIAGKYGRKVPTKKGGSYSDRFETNAYLLKGSDDTKD